MTQYTILTRYVDTFQFTYTYNTIQILGNSILFLFTLSTHISIKCFQYPRSSSPRIWAMPGHWDVNITWRIEPMKIRPSVSSSLTGNRSLNCWPVLQQIGILFWTVKMLCIHCVAFIWEKKWWCIYYNKSS